MATAKLGLEKQSLGTVNWHTEIENNWDRIDDKIVKFGSVNPNDNAVVADYAGQVYFNTVTLDRWVAIGAGTGNWRALFGRHNKWTSGQYTTWVDIPIVTGVIQPSVELGNAFRVNLSTSPGNIIVDFPILTGDGATGQVLPAGTNYNWKLLVIGGGSPYAITWRVPGVGHVAYNQGVWYWPQGAEGQLTGAGAIDLFAFESISGTGITTGMAGGQLNNLLEP